MRTLKMRITSAATVCLLMLAMSCGEEIVPKSATTDRASGKSRSSEIRSNARTGTESIFWWLWSNTTGTGSSHYTNVEPVAQHYLSFTTIRCGYLPILVAERAI